MARPTKTGMDYFPLDCTLSDEVEAVEAVHGNDGFAVIIKVWQALYQTENGELDCSGVLRRKTLAKRANISEERWMEVIGTCVEAGLFLKDEWENDRILISTGVKKRMAKVMQEREAGRKRAEKRWSKSSSAKNTPGNHRKKHGSESEKESESESEKKKDTTEESAKRGSKSDDPDPLKSPPLKNPGFSVLFMAETWPDYLKRKKGKYKNLGSQEVALAQLYRLCGGDEPLAVEALTQTVANGYQGFTWFFDRQPKQQNHAAGTTKNGNPHAIANAAAIQALQRGRVAESPAGVGNRSG